MADLELDDIDDTCEGFAEQMFTGQRPMTRGPPTGHVDDELAPDEKEPPPRVRKMDRAKQQCLKSVRKLLAMRDEGILLTRPSSQKIRNHQNMLTRQLASMMKQLRWHKIYMLPILKDDGTRYLKVKGKWRFLTLRRNGLIDFRDRRHEQSGVALAEVAATHAAAHDESGYFLSEVKEWPMPPRTDGESDDSD